MKGWRPENWEETKPDFGSGTTAPFCHGFDEGVEDGADAILEALQAEPAIRLNNKLKTIDQYIINIKDLPDGIWRVVLVPEIDPDLEELCELIPEKGG